MTIQLPPEMEARFRTEDVMLDLALGMYLSDRMTFGGGAEIAGLTQLEFQRELGRRQIPPHYDRHDLAVDLEAVRELSGS